MTKEVTRLQKLMEKEEEMLNQVSKEHKAKFLKLMSDEREFYIDLKYDSDKKRFLTMPKYSRD